MSLRSRFWRHLCRRRGAKPRADQRQGPAGIPPITCPSDRSGHAAGPGHHRPRRQLAQGDTASSPLLLGWHSGNFCGTYGLLRASPNRRLRQPRSRQYQPQSLGGDAPGGRHLFRSEDRVRRLTGAATYYGQNWENPATDYETGDILNLEGAVTKNFGASASAW